MASDILGLSVKPLTGTVFEDLPPAAFHLADRTI
eukprot:CAMPEP_0172375192 /NCGR_PEP_ID=MMETSP1060-20121228/60254_1 /TAXON_ID=37318 /ORGANISM="Pseudo-nitzschia pungens, Strain cf. cingulata" /LENGTH=33 /DNA_ID= /DNA_START= /DNA_END= /DNA_ORIENTATION=